MECRMSPVLASQAKSSASEFFHSVSSAPLREIFVSHAEARGTQRYPLRNDLSRLRTLYSVLSSEYNG